MSTHRDFAKSAEHVENFERMIRTFASRKRTTLLELCKISFLESLSAMFLFKLVMESSTVLTEHFVTINATSDCGDFIVIITDGTLSLFHILHNFGIAIDTRMFWFDKSGCWIG